MGDRPAGMRNAQAHHDLPKAFRDKFQKVGLDIDDPAYGRWVEGTPPGRQQNWSPAFNKAWEDFFTDTPKPTRQQILREMNRLRSDPRFQ